MKALKAFQVFKNLEVHRRCGVIVMIFIFVNKRGLIRENWGENVYQYMWIVF